MSLLPTIPLLTIDVWLKHNCRRQSRQHFSQLRSQPRMQHRVRTTGDAFGSHLAARRAKQSQQFSRSVSHILVFPTFSRTALVPALPGHRNGLKRSGFVFCPDCQIHLSTQGVSSLDQLFFASASISTTRTASPLLRRRVEIPVSHQVRVCRQPKPASLRTI